MKFILLFVAIFLVSSVSAGLTGDIGLDLRPETPAIIEGANYSINVNNTEHFDGYTLTEHKSWLQTQFDNIYCKLTGCTMTGDLTTSGDITADYIFANISQAVGFPITDISGLVPYTNANQNLDINSNKITSLADGTSNSDAINLGQLNSAVENVSYFVSSSGLPNGELVFDGSNAYLDVSFLNVASTNTVSFWQKSTVSTGTTQYAFDSQSGRVVIGRNIGNGFTQMGYYDGTSWHYVSYDDYLDGLYHHYVFVNNVSGNLTIYVDGVLDINEPSTPKGFSGTTSIGSRYGGTLNHYGSIDEFMIFNRSLSASEISDIYDLDRNDYTGSETDLVIYYEFDGEPNDFTDSSINDDNASAVGTIYTSLEEVQDASLVFINGSVFDIFNLDINWYGFFNITGNVSIDGNLDIQGNVEIQGDLNQPLDNSKFSQGASTDISERFDGTNKIINAEIGTPDIYWTNFGAYIFDNMVKIANAYFLPTTDGNNGEVITANGDGTSDFKPITMMHPITLTTYDAEPTRGAETNIHGGLDNLIMTQTLNSATNISVTKGNGKVMILVNTGSDFTGSLTIHGESIDRNTGASTPSDTDIMTISQLSSDTSTTDGNGNTVHNLTNGYASSKWFTGNIIISSTDLTLTDVDIYHISFEQFKDVENITLNTFDVNLYTTNVNAEFDSYLYKVADGNNRMNVTSISELHIGTDGETALANKYWRLRRGNLNEFINGTHSGIFIDTHYSNSPAYIEDVTQKIWATQTI